MSVRRRQDQTDAGVRGSLGAFRAREPGAAGDAAARAGEIAAQGRALWAAPRRQALVAELSGLKASALRKRVLAAGCSEEEMEEAEDAEDPQQAMIDLVVARMPDTGGGGGEADGKAAKRKALIAELSRLKPSNH